MSELRVTIDEVMSWRPCGWNGKNNGVNYTRERVENLFDRRGYMTARQILDLDISIEDRIRAVLRERLIPASTLRLFACDCADHGLEREQTIGRKPDERSLIAIETGRRYALFKASLEDMIAAKDAAKAVLVDKDKNRTDADWAAWAVALSAARTVERNCEIAARHASFFASRAAIYATVSRSLEDRDAAWVSENEWQMRHLRNLLDDDK